MPNYLFVNFKTYEGGTGESALGLAKLLSTFYTGEVEIIPVLQALDMRIVSESVPLKLFAQHVDAVKYGSNTGKILPEALKAAGASGTILNHAENKIPNDAIKSTIARCHEAGLKVMVCAETLQRAKEIAAFSPDFIAVEPPELIGGKMSVSAARPELISDSVKAISKINPNIIVITGAGVKNAEDVSKAIALGTSGVFVASGIVCAEDKEYAVRQLLSGFPSGKDDGKMP
ncbi:MAG: triose-phosphate isomerase [Candidatus Diapherotrites archaeon]|uniref:Triosephosphate isomerase n=1 Tax=Candidatus Iainarchaeum sp. TaxID=3101447 RepID=A0A8T3YK68_9ARCH|nr:triose-phosphate isomerase [Candidatus Diapherotrites archaeon]